MATLKARLDRAAKAWAALQDQRDARNVAVLLDLGITVDMPIDAWPAHVQAGIQAHGWTLQQAHELLQRWHNTVTNDTIIIHWNDGHVWDERTEAPMLVIAPGMLDALAPDGSELLPTVTPDETQLDKVTYVYQPQPRPRKLFPHEQAERQRNRRPNWRTR